MMSKSNMAETNMAEIPIWRKSNMADILRNKGNIDNFSYFGVYQPLSCNFIKQQLTSYGSLNDSCLTQATFHQWTAHWQIFEIQ